MNKEYEQDNVDNRNMENEHLGSEGQDSEGSSILNNEDGIYTMKRDEIKYNHWQANSDHTQDTDHTQPTPSLRPSPRKKNSFRFVALVIAAIIFGVIAGAAFQGTNYIVKRYFPQFTETMTDEKQEKPTENVQIDKENEIATTSITAGITSDNDVSHVVETAMPSIVSITSTVTQSYNDFFGNQYNEDSQGSGSGIIVGKNDNELLIVTNHHVITDSKSIKVTFINNDILDAKIKGTDQSADLAVVAVNLEDIKEDTLDKIKVASLGDSTKVKVGQMSIAIGNALGYGQSVTVGYISAKDRKVNVDNKNMTLLQTDAAINPGNSGGALLNVNGEVIGINSVKYASNEVEGMGYAIPISKALPIINELMNKVEVKKGEEGYLGIMGQDVIPEFSEAYDIPMGAYIVEVLEGGASDKAGLLPGDIITAINGIEATSMASVKEKVSSYPADTTISVTIQRREGASYKELDIDVVLEKLDATQFKEQPQDSLDNVIIPPFGYEITPE